MRRLALLSASMAMMLMSGCAGFYLHDEALAARVTAAETQFNAAKLATPFELEETYLAGLAVEEDRAVIEVLVAERDRQLANIIDADDKTAGGLLLRLTDLRLEQLVGSKDDNGILDALANAAGMMRFTDQKRASTELALKREQDQYAVFAGAKALTCDAVIMKGDTPGQIAAWDSADAAGDAAKPDYWEGLIYKDCVFLKRQTVIGPFDALSDPTGGRQGRLGAAMDAYDAAAAKTGRVEEAKGDAAIQALIDEAKDISRTGSRVQLGVFTAKVQSVLDGLIGVARLAGWEKIEAELADVIRGRICASESPADAAQRAEAKCDSQEPGDTRDKATALWKMLAAVAGLNDALELDGRNANWMLAASAIANANVVDAQIEASRDKAVATHLRARVTTLAAEASALACTKLALVPGAVAQTQQRLNAGNNNQSVACTGRGGTNLALASYIESWNSGAIPARVHEVRSDREDRAAALKRARAAGERQIALITAGVRQAKLYADGGFKPDLIAELLQALALVTIVGDSS